MTTTVLRRGAALAAGAATAATTLHLYTHNRPSLSLEAPKANGIVTESIVLKDGRRLAFAKRGDGDVPVFAFHGMGSSHLTWTTKPELPLSQLCSDVSLISVDRPGYGDSSPPPAGYSYAQWTDDVAQLADALGVKRFCVVGHSSGGPYALAAAALLPERVVACAAVASDPPYMHPRAPAGLAAMGLAFPGDSGDGLYGKDPAVKFGKWRAQAMAGDDATKRHAWKGGATGFVVDYQLERLPWAFRLEDIKLGSACAFWVGDKDYETMTIGAPFMQSLVAGAACHFVPGASHGSVKSEPTNLSAILRTLVAAWRQNEAASPGA